MIAILAMAILRALFFFFINDWGAFVSSLLYTLPIVFQFITFSLLVVFYVKQTSKTLWQRRWRLTVALYVIANVLFFGFVLAYCIIEFVYEIKDNPNSEWIGATNKIVTGSVFLVLVLILAYYAYKVFRLVRAQTITVPYQLRGTADVYVLSIVITIVFIFIVRSAYDFITVTMTDLLVLQADFSAESFLIMGLYTFWEIVPALLLIILFWEVSGRSHKQMRKPQQAAPIQDGLLEDEEQSGIFSNDLRYDSDEDDRYPPLLDFSPANYVTPYATTPKQT